MRIVLLDFAKAFDLITCKTPSERCATSYIKMDGKFSPNRTQQVKIGKTVSSVGYPKGGVPQGTVMNSSVTESPFAQLLRTLNLKIHAFLPGKTTLL